MKKRAFTLAEWLIVLMVLITLMGMYLLSTSSASARADATKIINDLKNLRTAAYAYFLDHREEFHKYWQESNINNYAVQALNLHDALGIGKYMSNLGGIVLNDGTGRDNSIAAGGYGVHDVNYRRKGSTKNIRQTWYVGYKFLDDQYEVVEILKERAKELGLHFSEKWPETNINQKYNIVWMKVFGDWSPDNQNP